MKNQEMYSPQNRVKQELQIGKWHVKENGDLEYDGYYHISGKRLIENDFIAHLFEKRWIDFNDFIPAYFQALKNIGEQYVNVRVFY